MFSGCDGTLDSVCFNEGTFSVYPSIGEGMDTVFFLKIGKYIRKNIVYQFQYETENSTFVTIPNKENNN